MYSSCVQASILNGKWGSLNPIRADLEQEKLSPYLCPIFPSSYHHPTAPYSPLSIATDEQAGVVGQGKQE